MPNIMLVLSSNLAINRISAHMCIYQGCIRAVSHILMTPVLPCVLVQAPDPAPVFALALENESRTSELEAQVGQAGT